MAVLLAIYIRAAIIVPAMVALGIVFDGFITLSDGIVADSNPRNAHKVNAAVAVMASKPDSSLRFKGLKLSSLKSQWFLVMPMVKF